jgi:hypothetical protein
MSRSGYSEDCEGWEWIRWRGAVASAIRGKRGQEFLRKLLAALDGLPVKRLIKHELEMDGEVCAIGAVGRMQGLDMSNIDPTEAEEVGAAFNIPPALVKEIVYVNDEWCWRDTPEQTFENVRKWVLSQLKTSTDEQLGSGPATCQSQGEEL